MHDEKKQAEYEARNERLKRLAENIDRGIGGRFYGADFQLAYSFMYGEIVELQREFNERFNRDMRKERGVFAARKEPRFAEFYDRIIQILESSEIVLLDSIDPNARKKRIEQLSKQKDEMLGKAGLEESPTDLNTSPTGKD